MSYRSSFHGRLKEINGVAIDNFTEGLLDCRAFFLSHCHTDHTQGLFSNELKLLLQKTPSIRIYMSQHSASIVRDNESYMYEELDKAIHVLKLGTTELTLPARDQYNEEYISVTLIPAGHCLGSVMFLFRTHKDQTILYTGDFRVRQNDLWKYTQLHSKGKPIQIDSLYVDTTFIEDKFENFPKRNECIDELTEHIKRWLEKGDGHKVALSFSAKYGYEYVMMELSQRLNMKIFVKDKYNLYSNMDFIKSAVTNDETCTRIHECRSSSKHASCGIKSYGDKFLSFRISAMRWENYDFNSSAVQRVDDNHFKVCYSTHCSSSEIRAFVEYFDPKSIEGFPYKYIVEKETFDHKLTKLTPLKSPFKISPVKSPQVKRRKLPDEKLDKDVVRKLLMW